MGLLSEGTPLSWPETKKHADHVREHGIKQFVNQFHQLKGRQGDCLKWGDEVGRGNTNYFISLRSDCVWGGGLLYLWQRDFSPSVLITWSWHVVGLCLVPLQGCASRDAHAEAIG